MKQTTSLHAPAAVVRTQAARSRRSAAHPALGSALTILLLVACPAVLAQPVDTAPAPVEPDKSLPDKSVADKSLAIPVVEIVAFDFLLNAYNRRFSKTTDYDVTWGSIRRNLRGPWVVDNDPFKVNQFAHPIQGSLYHGAGRASGLGYWESSALTFAGSMWWEITGEKTPPSRNDQIASGIGGSFLGEPLFRMARLVTDRSDLPASYRNWIAAGISPAVGFNRMMYGSRFDSAFVDNDPAYYGRMHVGATHVAQHDFNSAANFKRNMLQIDFALDYGLPGKTGYTYKRPFDYFSAQVLFSSANGIENLSTRGLLYGTDYGFGDNYRGIWGLYANYDYLSPQIFHVSTTSLSLGTTAQWLGFKDYALQGTVLAGLGYAAASTARSVNAGVSNDSEYHYGTATRAAVALRAIKGDRAALDVSARMVSLGNITRRSAGRDEIYRVDTAFTWRIQGPHGVGINYLWSHRSASYQGIDGSRQSLGTAGIYYTLLGQQGFSEVDWRPRPAN